MRVLVIGPGPAAIGEGAELDAACTEAMRALAERGHAVVLATSSAATVASDPALAERTYLEPLDGEALDAIVAAERPDAILPLFGGAKACALAVALAKAGAHLLGPGPDALGAAITADVAGARTRLDAEPGWTAVELVVASDAGGERRVVCAIESLDRAGVHPGDAVSVTPPITLSAVEYGAIEHAAHAALAGESYRGCVATVDLAIRRDGGEVRVIGVTPWFARSCALASYAAHAPIASLLVDLALGRPLAELPDAKHDGEGFVVRWPRFAFETFPDADAALGALRKSLGESLGAGSTPADALRAATRGASDGLTVARPVRSAPPSTPGSRSVLVLGPGPTRIGHGPELATCANEVLVALREGGYSPVFVDESLESTTLARAAADRVHVEPVTLERVLAVYARERASGVIVQVGGDTALRLASSLVANGATVFGTAAAALERAVARPADADTGTSLDRAIAVHVDGVADGNRVVIAGVMEQLEPAYVHAGDAAAILPAFTLRADVLERVESVVRSRAIDLGIVGLLSVHVAISGDDVTILEFAPRAGRTTAFVSRVTGVPLVRIATKVMLGATLDELGVSERPLPRHVAARERVFPFERLGVDTALGPEMRSTGEVIGLDDTPARAYAKALRAMGGRLRPPARDSGAPHGVVVVDVTERDRSVAIELARRLRAIGYDVLAASGTRKALAAARIPFRDLDAISEIESGRAALAIVTAEGPAEIARTRAIRGAALAAHIPCFTTVALARLGCAALEEGTSSRVRPLQDWYAADT